MTKKPRFQCLLLWVKRNVSWTRQRQVKDIFADSIFWTVSRDNVSSSFQVNFHRKWVEGLRVLSFFSQSVNGHHVVKKNNNSDFISYSRLCVRVKWRWAFLLKKPKCLSNIWDREFHEWIWKCRHFALESSRRSYKESGIKPVASLKINRLHPSAPFTNTSTACRTEQPNPLVKRPHHLRNGGHAWSRPQAAAGKW